MPSDTDNGWAAHQGVLVSSRRKPNDAVRRLRMPTVVRRGIDPVEVAIAAILISGLVASVLLALAAVFTAAWLVVVAVRELLRAMGA